jgi:hypothetical protein
MVRHGAVTLSVRTTAFRSCTHLDGRQAGGIPLEDRVIFRQSGGITARAGASGDDHLIWTTLTGSLAGKVS